MGFPVLFLPHGHFAHPHPPFPSFGLGVPKLPQGWDKMPLVLDSRWPCRCGRYLLSSGTVHRAWRQCGQVTLRQTHKFLCAWEIKELHQPKVISCDNVQASMGHTRAVNVSLVCIPRPDANDFVSQNAVQKGRGVRRRLVRRLRALRHP